MKHTSSKLTAEEIALDFLEVFQNSYPEKPSWQLIEPFANKIKEYASQSEVTEVSEHDINKNVMQIIEDCCTEIGVNTTSIREGITEYIRSLLSHQTKAETKSAEELWNQYAKSYMLHPSCDDIYKTLISKEKFLEAFASQSKQQKSKEASIKFLSHLVDVAWGEAYEDGQVPSTGTVKSIIEKAVSSFDPNDIFLVQIENLFTSVSPSVVEQVTEDDKTLYDKLTKIFDECTVQRAPHLPEVILHDKVKDKIIELFKTKATTDQEIKDVVESMMPNLSEFQYHGHALGFGISCYKKALSSPVLKDQGKEPDGWIFNGRVYKSLDELKAQTMHEGNQPKAFYFSPPKIEGKEPKKPLSEITDEDAIEVSNIVFPNLSKISNKVSIGKDIVSEHYRFCFADYLKVFQYLQSKNYELPIYFSKVEEEKGGDDGQN